MSAAALLLLFASRTASAEEPCHAIAVVDGPADAVEEMARALSARGIEVEPPGYPPGRCDTLFVDLQPHEGGYLISIRDPWGRSASREVKSLATAAPLIESWARLDLLEGVGARTATISEEPREQEPEKPEVAPIEIEAALEPKKRGGTPFLHLVGEIGIGRDGTKWTGASTSGCFDVAFLCLGGTTRFAIDEQRASDFDMLVDVDLPIPIDIITLTPGLGLGWGWADRGEPLCIDSACDGRRETIDPQSTKHGARIELRILGSIRILEQLHFSVGARITVDPFEGGPFEDRYLTIFRGSAGFSWGTP